MITTTFSQHHPSIHQQQLEYYNANYVQPAATDTTQFINPILSRTQTSSKEVFGYHPYWMGTAWTNYDFDLISTLAYFSVEITEIGGLGNLHGWPVVSLINEAHSHGTKVVLCATLFNSDDLITLLSNPLYRQNLIDNLLEQVQLGNADGVNIDFESFPVSQKENMVNFTTELTNAFHATIPGSQVTLATPAVDWSNAWDYNALASISDGLFIMGYAYHWSGSETTGPNSPLSGPGYTLTWTISDYLEKTNYQLDKLILGCPYFGFEWASSANTPGSNTLEVGNAKFYSEIEGLALSYGKLWHQSSQTPWYTYNNNGWNQGWYDDSLSLSLKYDFALYTNLKGIGIWALGYDAGREELWNLLHEKFGEAELELEEKNIYNIINPSPIMIHNIYPNPTNSSIIISFSTMKKNSLSKISIYDLFGNLISNTSTHTTNMPFKYVWNGLNYEGEIVPSGTYFVSILQGSHRDTRKLTIVK